MRRLSATIVVLSVLAACSQNEEGKKAIVAQCVSNGDTPEVCDCLARNSAERLDQDLFDLVVMGARGEETEAAQRMEGLAPELQAKFSVLIPQILKDCGADS
jgi:hypothetical protein